MAECNLKELLVAALLISMNLEMGNKSMQSTEIQVLQIKKHTHCIVSSFNPFQP